MLEGKTPAERADIKAAEIVKRMPVGTYDNSTYGLHIDIQNIEKIDGGIQIFARAWKDDNQLGFGADGSVEIERFRIFNPPILVDDPNGGIVRHIMDAETGGQKDRRLKEDPVAAIRASLAHTVSLVGKEGARIIVGKRGNTTDTFYPILDGRSDRGSVTESFSSLRNGAGTSAQYDQDGTWVAELDARTTSNMWGYMYVPFLASIPLLSAMIR